MQMLSIGEVARRTGIAPSAIRYYERIGLIAPPERRSGRRVYPPSVVPWVEVIKVARGAGFTIAEIHILLHGFAPDTPPATRWQRMAQAKLVEIDQQLRRLQQMQALLERGLRCGCLRLEDCVSVLRDHGAAPLVPSSEHERHALEAE